MNDTESIIYQTSEIRKKKQIIKKNNDSSIAAKELLKNGILVETNNGLICMSLKDALNKGVAGHTLSVKDFQNVATELLCQDKQNKLNKCEKTLTWSKKGGISTTILKKLNANCEMNGDLNKVSLTSAALKKNRNSVNLEEFKDIQESFMNFSASDYSFLDKTAEDPNEFNVEFDGKSVFSFKGSSDLKFNEKTKKPFVNKLSLLANRNTESVISVQNMVKNLKTRNEIMPSSKCKIFDIESVLINSYRSVQDNPLLNENSISCEEASDTSEVTVTVIDKSENKPVKKRGGWPKGRKRKPEIKHEIRPPKAPATGYVIFLNERRKDYKDMPFTEVTKILGNEWSKLNLQEKKIYLEQAEREKKRYREELKLYRQSDAYQTYLQNKRLKRLQGNGTEESDMDATDEIDEEDNEELYCRACDLWFHSLHNKKEHLYGRQHLQSIAGRCYKSSDPDWGNPNMSSTSLDESSLDGSSYLTGNKEHCCIKDKDSLNINDAIVKFMAINKEREDERKILKKKLEESRGKNQALTFDLQNLNEVLGSMTCMNESEKTTQILLEQHLFNLLNVPTLFYLPEPLNEEN